MGFIQRRIVKAVLAVVAWPKVTLAIAGALLVLSATLAWTRLTISTDENKLFSNKVQFFRDYCDFSHKFPENEALYVVIAARDPSHPPEIAQWTGIADAVVARLQKMPNEVRRVEAKVSLEDLGAQGVLFQTRDELRKQVEGLRGLAFIWGREPDPITALVLRGNTRLERFINGTARTAPDAQTAAFVSRMVASWNDALDHPAKPLKLNDGIPDLGVLGAMSPRDLGYSYVPDESNKSKFLLLVSVYQQDRFDKLTAISETVNAIRTAVNTVAAGYPDFKVGITGRPALEADELQTSDRDTTRAEIIAGVVIFLGLIAMLRSVYLALVAELTLGVGIGWTFGWATISVGELNLLSLVFVIALIGIGMDYLIQILVRYRREARRYERQKAIWARVFRYVSPPISTACLGAAGAFFVSIFTDFQGAAELGIIAGGGLLLCLLAGYTVLPAILVLFPPRMTMRDPAERYSTDRPPPRVGGRGLLVPALWLLAIVVAIPFMFRAQFDPNLLNMQSPSLQSVQLVHKLQTWYGVVLSDDLAQLREARTAVMRLPEVAGTESILDQLDNERWLAENPGILPTIAVTAPPAFTSADVPRLASSLESLAAKFDAAREKPAAAILRAFAARLAAAQTPADRQPIAERLTAWQSGFVQQISDAVHEFNPAPKLNIDKLPPAMREHLLYTELAPEPGAETRGPSTSATTTSSSTCPTPHRTYALYIYPKANLWDRLPLQIFVHNVEGVVTSLPVPANTESLRVTGVASDIYHTTSAIRIAFRNATIYALIVVFLLVLLDLRSISQTLLAISVLALGLPMLVALMGLCGVSWNFANFFGLPILIGAGHEYGVFLVHRYREVLHNPRRIWRPWDVSDRAMLLCAFVTCSSFGFLALGQHKGMQSLGLVMMLGIASIYLAGVLVLRPLLTWQLTRKGIYNTLATPPEKAKSTTST